MHIRFVGAGAVFALALSACGHSGSAVVPPARSVAAVAPSPTPAPSVGAAASAKRSTMTISVAIPAKKASASRGRGTKTVSPSTAYVDVVLKSLEGDAQPVNGPYSTVVAVSQLGTCQTGGRSAGRAAQSANQRAPQSNYSCVTVNVPAPVGHAIYAVAALDANMTLLDYIDGVPVTVDSSGTAAFTATLNGVGASLYGYTMLGSPGDFTNYKTMNAVDCSADVLQYEPKAVCSFEFNVLDGSGSDMFVNWQSPGLGRLANFVTVTATDTTSQQALNVTANNMTPMAENPTYEVDFDPATDAPGWIGNGIYAGAALKTYNAVIHPDLSEIPNGTTTTVDIKAVMQPAGTTTFGPNVVVPVTQAATYTWDYSCSTVTVPAGDPSGVAEGTVLHYCMPQESNLAVTIR
ncbi:MAG: hypothetical protein JWM87_973 [Candidatus Eremiobacteraeota bacterium]|nr:hypothetical protein [Candidatus Eremiobacteraeota bacterium]